MILDAPEIKRQLNSLLLDVLRASSAVVGAPAQSSSTPVSIRFAPHSRGSSAVEVSSESTVIRHQKSGMRFVADGTFQNLVQELSDQIQSKMNTLTLATLCGTEPACFFRWGDSSLRSPVREVPQWQGIIKISDVA